MMTLFYLHGILSKMLIRIYKELLNPRAVGINPVISKNIQWHAVMTLNYIFKSIVHIQYSVYIYMYTYIYIYILIIWISTVTMVP